MTSQARDWTSSVPAGWSFERLRFLIDFIESGTSVNAIDVPAEEHQLGVLKTSAVYTRKFRPEENKAVVPEERDRVSCPLREGAIVVSRMNTPELVGAAGLVGKAPSNIYLPDRLWQVVVEPDRACAGYLHWFMCSQCYNDQIRIACSGSSSSMQNLGQDQFRNFVLPRPPLELQVAIASYLDAETARIDGLIEEKRRLVLTLGELRASVMGEAIQRGLNAGVVFAETGVPWLGQAPKHWQVMRLKHLLDNIEQGWSPQCDARLAEDGEWGVLKAGACNGGIFHPEEHKTLQAEMEGDPSIEVKPGDLLMSRASGSLDLVGSVAYVDSVRTKLMLSDKIFRLKLDESRGTSAEWLAMAFNTPNQRRQIASHVGGAEGLARNIASSAIKELWLAVPPPEEQKEVVAYASVRVAQIDDLTRYVEAEIALLQELRAATITDAVLGRIDVREHMKN